MSKKLAAVAAAVLFTTVAATPAQAATLDYNYTMSCPQGGVYTSAHGNYTVTHTVWAGTVREKVFPSDSWVSRTTTFYTGQPVTTRAKIQNSDKLTNGVYNCND